MKGEKRYFHQDILTSDFTWNTYNTNWRWTYGIIYHNSGSGEVSHYDVQVWLQNTQWTDYYNDGTASNAYSSSYSLTCCTERKFWTYLVYYSSLWS